MTIKKRRFLQIFNCFENEKFRDIGVFFLKIVEKMKIENVTKIYEYFQTFL